MVTTSVSGISSPGATEDCLVEDLVHINPAGAQSSHVSMVRKFGEWSANLDIFHVSERGSKLPRSIACSLVVL
ncbi:hypothetical protein TNCV_4457161 [Trichonephila clavipes]|nr:hypothetical protein TNCV_4457161 [Trichonephila clavipes]